MDMCCVDFQIVDFLGTSGAKWGWGVKNMKIMQHHDVLHGLRPRATISRRRNEGDPYQVL